MAVKEREMKAAVQIKLQVTSGVNRPPLKLTANVKTMRTQYKDHVQSKMLYCAFSVVHSSSTSQPSSGCSFFIT